MAIRHFLQFKDFSREEFEHLFARTRWIKDRFKRYERYQPLRRPHAGDGLRKAIDAHASFVRGGHAPAWRLGDHPDHARYTARPGRTDRRRRAGDHARMVDIVMIRTFEQDIIERFAAHSRVPVVNGLTNEYHPCQIMGDIYTFMEHRGDIHGKTVAWIGDSNNVCNTWLQAAELFDFNVHVSTPPGYEVEPQRAGLYGTEHYEVFDDPMEAVKGADLITTDVWTSMGFEDEDAERKRAFEDWQVDAEMMRAARADALFMHCLPAHRGEEVAADVIDGPQSIVWDEAENRLHTQKALMEFLLLGRVAQ